MPVILMRCWLSGISGVTSTNKRNRSTATFVIFVLPASPLKVRQLCEIGIRMLYFCVMVFCAGGNQDVRSWD